MKIVLAKDMKIEGDLYEKGDFLEVEEEFGNSLIAGGMANNPRKEKKEIKPIEPEASQEDADGEEDLE